MQNLRLVVSKFVQYVVTEVHEVTKDEAYRNNQLLFMHVAFKIQLKHYSYINHTG